MYAKIEPVPAFNGPATILAIGTVTVRPGASATYPWILESDARAVLSGGSIYLVGDAYTAWGSDDEYLLTYAAQFLGLTIIEIVPDAPVVQASAPVDATPAPAPSNE